MAETFPRIELAPPGRTLHEHAQFADLAGQHGFTGAWVSEINGFEFTAQALMTGKAIAPHRVGSAIVPMQTRDPLLMAMTAGSLNQALEGHFVLGLGTSTPIIIEGWHATDFGRPLALTRECVTLVRRFLAGERVSADTGRWRYRGASLGAGLAAPVPIYLGALNDRMLQLAGEIGDGVILNFASLEYLEHAREQLVLGRKQAGKSMDGFEVVVYFRCSFMDSFDEVRERYQREFLTYVMAPVYQKMWGREGLGAEIERLAELWREGRREEALAAIPDRLAQERVLLGSAAEIAETLRRYAAAGMDTAIVMPVARPGRDYVAECEAIIAGLGAHARRPVSARSDGGGQ